MNQQTPCDDKSLLIDYLYGEGDAAERRFVEQHLEACANCAAEIARLRGVRGTLREWAPPEQALGFRVVREEVSARRRGVWLPAWAQLAAAVLVLAVGAAIANLDVRIGNGGVTIRTGWQKPPAADSGFTSDRGAAAAPWRADFAALERQLRHEMSANRVAAPAAGAVAPLAPPARESAQDRAAFLRKVQALIDDADRRQRHDVDQQIAERFLRLAHDVDTQRIADQRRVLQGLSQIDLRTTQLSQVQNYLLRVANVQEIK